MTATIDTHATRTATISRRAGSVLTMNTAGDMRTVIR